MDRVGRGANGDYDLVVDAVLGYGLRGAPTGRAGHAIEWIVGQAAPVVSLDLPSGLHPDTGEAFGGCVRADTTLTLHLPKPGLTDARAGAILVADLGIPPSVTRRCGVEPLSFGPELIVEIGRTTASAAQPQEARARCG